jgi:hypothetical protein
MGKQFEIIDDTLRQWIAEQKMFFVGTAPVSVEGLLNISPKGYDTLRILNGREVAYLDLTGSGIETLAHVRENGRIVFMFCSFDQTARIVRLHGTASAYEPGTPEFERLLPYFASNRGMRAIIHAKLNRISDSCGYSVPRYDYRSERPTLEKLMEKKTDAEIRDYQLTRNARSLDGLPGLNLSE